MPQGCCGNEDGYAWGIAWRCLEDLRTTFRPTDNFWKAHGRSLLRGCPLQLERQAGITQRRRLLTHLGCG